MSLNEMVISQSSAKGPCRIHNENIRLHTERTPCRVEDQWCGLMKGGWCSWWLGRQKKGQKGRDLWCWLSNTLSTVPVLWLSQSEVTQIYITKGSCCCCICRFTPINTTMLFFFPFKILLNHLSDHFVYFIWFGFDIFIQKLILNHQRGKTRSKGPLYSSPVAPCGHLLTHWVKVAPNPNYVTKHVTRYLRWVTAKYSNKTDILHTISGPLGIQA